jgi:lactoylglutathione lyase
MKQIKGINHVGLRVSNLEATRKFYEKLGFEFIAGPLGPEPVAIMLHPSGVNINFILNSTDKTTLNVLMDITEKHTGYTHVALEVNDLSSTQEYLKSIDYKITEGPIVTPDGSSFVFIRDGDDNVIEFHQPKEK